VTYVNNCNYQENKFSGFRFLVSGFWFPVSGFWFPVSGFRFLVSGFWKKTFLFSWGGPEVPAQVSPRPQPLFSWFAGDLYK